VTILGLICLVGCTPRVSAELQGPPAEPQTNTAAPSSDPASAHGRWYGDLKVVPRKLVAQPEPSPSDKDGDGWELPPPTAEELAAWDRKDSAHEAELREWDRANLDEVSGWWHELQCFHLAVTSVGNSTYNANDAERWLLFESVYEEAVRVWLPNVTNPQPGVISSSKAFGYALEAEELLRAYPGAFERGDAAELQQLDEQWANMAMRFNNYLAQLGASRPALDPEHADDLATCRSFLDSW
jgi:hypothetical protein